MTGTMYGARMDGRDGETLTVQEAAARLGVLPRQVHELLTAGRLKATKVGGTWAIPLAEVDTYDESRTRELPDAVANALDGFWRRITALRAERDAVIEARNRYMVRQQDAGHSVAALGRAAHMGRQNAHLVVARTRAQLAEEAARRRQ